MKMLSISSSLTNTLTTLTSRKDSNFLTHHSLTPKFVKYPFNLSKNPLFSHQNLRISSRNDRLFVPKSSGSDPEAEGSSVVSEKDEWLSKLPDKKKPLYAHSLPCIDAWLTSLGFYQSKDDRAVWFVEKLGWHAQLSLNITEIHIRYLKNGPGNLDKDVERRFSYALSREDIAVLGGP